MKNYRINTPHIVHEVFTDDEAAVINLKTGNYFSLNPTAAEIWMQIDKAQPIEAINQWLSHNYEGDTESFRDVLQNFISILEAEDLIVENENGSVQNHPLVKDVSPTKRAFTMPVIEKFADMQELLLLDPIHEVEDAGFPYQKAN